MIGKQSPDIEALLAAKKAVWELQFFNLDKKLHLKTMQRSFRHTKPSVRQTHGNSQS